MNESIRCEYPLTWERYCSWVKADQFRGGRLVVNLLLLALGLACLVLAFPLNFMSIMMIGLFIMCVYVVFFNWRYNARTQYRLTARKKGGENWTRRIVFEENSITFSDGGSSRSVSYGDLTGMKEKPNEISLYFGRKLKLVLYPDAFTQGSWPECRALLKAKTRK